MGRVVLVTGVSRYLGGRLASRLSLEPGIDRIIGVDVIPPPHPIGEAEFMRADIRNPMIGKVIEQAEIDTVVHMNVIATPTFAGGRAPQKEINVIGTMQLLAACQKSERVQHLVVKSSAAVYGSTSRDPGLFREDMAAKVIPGGGFGKDSIEVESYVRGYARRRPDARIAMLRFANIIGPGVRTSLTDYFGMPVIPVPMGYDARLQFVHEDDAVEALRIATIGDADAVVNVAGDGVLTVLQAAALTGRPWVAVPKQAAGPLGNLAKRLKLADFSGDQIEFLSHGRGLDTTAMRQVLGFAPDYTTREAFLSFAEGNRPMVGTATMVDAVSGAGSRAGAGLRRGRGLLGGDT